MLVAVVIVHWVATRELADRMASFDAAQQMPRRIEVAYLRTIEPEAPPALAAPAAPPPRPARRAPRAPHPVVAAASAVEPPAVVAEVPAPAASAVEPEAVAAAPADAASAAASSVPAATVAGVDASASAAAASAAAASGAVASTAAAVPFEWPASTRVSYVLTGNYRGEVSGTAQVEWIRVGERYQVNLDLVVGPEFAPLITRRMTSEGAIATSGLVPDRYDEDTHVAFRERRRMTVVFENDAVVLANGERRERLAGVQDTASQFVQLTWLFSTEPSRLRVGNAVAFPLALPRAMDSYVYDVTEAQTLATPFGAIEAFHLKPRPRPTRRPGTLSAELWIAPELRYLPVRIRIEQDAATFIDLMIARKPEIGAAAPSSPAASSSRKTP
ncbi:MAG TPA: DUF3108 domain-containing protein [Caldimonas sp.]|nr:DUF3108 domain-containing protein [Caldimonas sp.]